MRGLMIGLGCMRLSTEGPRDRAAAIRVIHAALDSGITLLDTADAYCLDDSEAGHNERLVAEALRTWPGDRSQLVVATKGGLRRPGGSWQPDGRAKHLRAACEASREALDVDVIDLYQLHALDPRTPLETSVRALARLQREGAVRDIGLCNVGIPQIEAARRIAGIHSVQVSLSLLDHTALKNGVARHCRDNGILLLAWRPLGGALSSRLEKDTVLVEIGRRHGVTPHEVALAWLLDLGATPLAGATREATARSLGRAAALELTDQDRQELDVRVPAGRLIRDPGSRGARVTRADGEVVLVMGMPGAGKTAVAGELVREGYERLNRDERGGPSAALVRELEAGLAAGRRRWVLDNTYPTRLSRSDVIECAARHGVDVRCVHMVTPLSEAQINATYRLIQIAGRLPGPDELRNRGREEPAFFGPDAQFRYRRRLEPPSLDEGFASVEERTSSREASSGSGRRALVLEYDGVLVSGRHGGAAPLAPADVVVDGRRRAVLERHARAGWRLLALAWRPQVESGELSGQMVRDLFERTRELVGFEIEIACCPHAPGPPRCWCRKPLPGLVLEFAIRWGVDLTQSLAVGRSPADRTQARRLNMPHVDHDVFFEAGAAAPEGGRP